MMLMHGTIKNTKTTPKPYGRSGHEDKPAILSGLLASAVPAAAFPAQITRCYNGDTCTAETEQGRVRVRVAETDALEIDPPYGAEARDRLCAMLCGRDVDIKPRGTSYARFVGLIRVGGLDTSEAMVRARAAWAYQQYDDDPIVSVLQAQARAGRLGLWAEPSAIPPWTWRHSR